jgi:hypothetical protein
MKLALILASLLITTNIFAEDTKDIRVGLKIGSPNLIGLSGEYVLPVMDRNFSINIDFSYLPSYPISGFINKSDFGSAESNITPTYWNIAANYYIFGKGDGLYAGVGYGRFAMKMDVKKIKMNGLQTTYQGQDFVFNTSDGEGTATFGANLIALKLGWKWTSGILNYGVELGYAMAKYDDNVNLDGWAILSQGGPINGKTFTVGQRIDFKDYIKQYNIKDNIPSVISSGFPMINFNIGLSF